MLIIPLPAFSDNYIWLLQKGNHAAVVDPGEAGPVLDYLQQNGLTLSTILITHHHKDHTGGIQDLTQLYPTSVYGPRNASIGGITHPLAEGDTITLPDMGIYLKVLEVPGHTLDHLAFYNDEVVFCGDTLFAGGCGRMFEGTPAGMLASLDKLAALPDHLLVHCAHEYTLANLRFGRAVEPGNTMLLERERFDVHRRERGLPTVPSSMGLERQTNPFLRCREPAVQTAASHFAGQQLTDPAAVFAALREAKNNF